MPKRKPDYMAAQREQIAEAVLGALMRKGLPDTTVRDMCVAAGISMGAFYIHFASRRDAIIAACRLRIHELEEFPVARTWADYEAAFRGLSTDCDHEPSLRRFRLSLHVVAEFALDAETPPGLVEAYEVWEAWFEKSLVAMAAAGEIAPPLAVADTARLHARLLIGMSYATVARKQRADPAQQRAILDGLAILAGRKP